MNKHNKKEYHIYHIFMFIFLYLFSSNVYAEDIYDPPSCDSTSTAARLICNFGTIIDISIVVGYAISGVLFFVAGLYMYLSQKKPQQYGAGHIIGALIAATLFISFTNLITLYQNLVFADDQVYHLNEYNEMLDRIGSGDEGAFGYMSSESMQALIAFVKVVGVFAMLKSIYLVYDAGRGNDPQRNIYFQIMIYAIGGALAFRVEDFSCILADFFGIASICLVG